MSMTSLKRRFTGDVPMEKNRKQMRAAKAKAEDAVLHRVLCWFAGGAVLELLLLILRRYYNNYRAGEIELRLALGTAVRIAAVAALVCAAAAAYWWNGARKADKPTNLPALLSFFMLGVSGSCFAAWLFPDAGLALAIVAVPVVIVLAMIFYLYQHEFFLISLQATLGILGVWVCGKGNGGMYAVVGYAYVAVAAVLVGVAALVCRKAQANNGVVERKGGQPMQLFSKGCNYTFLYAGAVITAAALVCAALGIASAILYSVQVAWLLAMAVYYTVKLM